MEDVRTRRHRHRRRFLAVAVACCYYGTCKVRAFAATRSTTTRRRSATTKPMTKTKLWFEAPPRGNPFERGSTSGPRTAANSTAAAASSAELSVSSPDRFDMLPPLRKHPETNANDDDDRRRRTARSSSSSSIGPDGKRKVYCDLDGCLVNFERGVRTLLHRGSADFESGRARETMWRNIDETDKWFETLEWQMDGKRLWGAIKHLRPDILTGVPFRVTSSRIEKFNWCKRELGIEDGEAHHVDMACVDTGAKRGDTNDDNDEDDEDDDYHRSVNGNFPREDKTNIITCWSSNKHKECHQRGSILIDDRIDLGKAWTEAGGIFVHHVNSETTIRTLRDLGVISDDDLDRDETGWYCGEKSWNRWTGDVCDDNGRRDDPPPSPPPTTTTTIQQTLLGLGMVPSDRDLGNDVSEGWYWGDGSWNLWTGSDSDSNRHGLEA